MPERCEWCLGHPLYLRYHDEEWGVPVHDDRSLFEFLILEGAQAGLSWLTILKRREGYRAVYEGFDPQQVALWGPERMAAVLSDARIIRNPRKVESSVRNAQAFLRVQDEFGSFAHYSWRFVEGQPIVNHWTHIDQLPASTPLSETMSRDLKQRGFSFVGPTIVYAHMQATGLVNDHMVWCLNWAEPGYLGRVRSAGPRTS